MRVRAITIVCAGLVGLLVPVASSAQDRRLEVTGFVGGLSISHDLGSVSNIYLTATGEAESVAFPKYFGVRVAYLLTPFVGVEGSLSRGSNRYTFSVDDRDLDTVSLGDQFDATELNYGGNVVIQYPLDNGLVPFGIAGVGQQRSSTANPIAGIEETVTGLDFNFGGGVRYFFDEQDLPWLGVRFDLRFHFISNGLAFDGNEASPRHTEFTFGGVIRPF